MTSHRTLTDWQEVDEKATRENSFIEGVNDFVREGDVLVISIVYIDSVHYLENSLPDIEADDMMKSLIFLRGIEDVPSELMSSIKLSRMVFRRDTWVNVCVQKLTASTPGVSIWQSGELPPEPYSIRPDVSESR
jgi:hypothetical protein